MKKREYERNLEQAMRKFIDGSLFTENDILVMSCATPQEFFNALISANSNRLFEIGDIHERLRKTRNFGSFATAVSTLKQGGSIKMNGAKIDPLSKVEYQAYYDSLNEEVNHKI